MTTTNPKSLVALLFQLARVDGELAEQEIRFIFDTGKRIGLSSGDIELIQYHPKDYSISIPKAEEERMVILYSMLFMMKIDNSISSAEEDMIRGVALRLGIRPQMTTYFIELMHQYVADEVPITLLLDEIKKYMN